jgi:hypothetical protein
MLWNSFILKDIWGMVKLNTQKHCVINFDLNHIYFALFLFSKKQLLVMSLVSLSETVCRIS